MDRANPTFEILGRDLKQAYARIHHNLEGNQQSASEFEQIVLSSGEELEALQQQEALCNQKRNDFEADQARLEVDWKNLALKLESENLNLKLEVGRLRGRETDWKELKSRLLHNVERYFIKYRVAKAYYGKLLSLRRQYGPEAMWDHVDKKTEVAFDEMLVVRLTEFQRWRRTVQSASMPSDQDVVMDTDDSQWRSPNPPRPTGTFSSSAHNEQKVGGEQGNEPKPHNRLESQRKLREQNRAEAARAQEEEERRAAEEKEMLNKLNANPATPGSDKLQKNVFIPPTDDRDPSIPTGPRGGHRGQLREQAPAHQRQPWNEQKGPGHPAGAPSAYDRIGVENRRANANMGGAGRHWQPNPEQLDGQASSRTRQRSISPAGDPSKKLFDGPPGSKKQRRE